MDELKSALSVTAKQLEAVSEQLDGDKGDSISFI